MESARSALEQYLARASLRGEGSVAVVRLVVAALGLLNLFGPANGGPGLLAGEPKPWLMSAGLLAGAGFSAWSLRRVRSGRAPPRLRELSVSVDALMCLVVILPIVAWPREAYFGLLGMTDFAFILLAIVVSGFRNSLPAVHLSGALNAGVAAIVLGVDLTQNADRAVAVASDYTLFAALMICSVLVARGIVNRTRELVMEGGEAALAAERARQRLGVYVSQEIADAALASEDLKPGGERRPVAVLFSDLRGFTSYSEKLPPEQLLRELNAYLDAMVQVIREEGGVVDKYIGDAIMVVFGIPRSRGNDAESAARTAWRMQRALDVHNDARAKQGLPALRQGVGVHYGEAIAGNIGTADRLQYTVVGDVVNVASRLESATKELGASIVISGDAARAAGAIDAAPQLSSCGSLSVRGRQEAMEVFTFTEPGAENEIAGSE